MESLGNPQSCFRNFPSQASIVCVALNTLIIIKAPTEEPIKS